jgi:hypothetical protein
MSCPTYLTQVDLAGRWLCSPRTIERWRQDGKGPPYMKIGGRVVYRLSDVEVWELSRLRSSTKDAQGLAG